MRTLRRESGQQMYTLVTSALTFVLTVVEVDYETYLWSGTLIQLQEGKDPKQVYSEVLYFTLYSLGLENRVAFNMLSEARNANPTLADEIEVLMLGM